ncbi:hypothetical protein ABPG72_020882 [Tetrahymena utriculariae]
MDIVGDQYQIFCQKHKHHLVNLINISQSNEQLLNCEECALETGNTKDYISIQTIKTCRKGFIFYNWPPVQDYKLLYEIQSIINDNDGIIQKIEQEYKLLIEQIVQQLEQQKKIILKQVNEKQQYIENIIRVYNQISGKDELKQFFIQSNRSIENNQKSLCKFIQDKIQNQSQNTYSLLQAIKQIQIQSRFQPNQFTELNKQITQQINQLSEKLMCNSEIQNSQYSQTFEDFSNTIQELNINEKQLTNNYLFSQNKEFQLQQFLQSNRLSIQSQTQESEQQQIQLLFGKAQQCINKSSQKIEVIEHYFISLKKNSSSKHGNVFFNYGLTKKKKYIFRFQFHDKAGDCLLIGLNDSQQEINNIQKACKIFCSNCIQYGGKVEKGEYFYQVTQDQIIELRVDISKKQILYLDYPNYQNVNALSEGQKIDPKKTYYLSIVFGNRTKYKTQLDLIYFQESEI